MPVATNNRTVSQVAIDQSAAGLTSLVSAPGVGLRIYVVTIVVTSVGAGSLVIQEGSTALTGQIAVAANGGFIASSGADDAPILHTPTANTALQINTTTMIAEGWLRYFVAA